MTELCNLDGTITAESEARIPVLDRGFLFGDSVYEVLRTRGGELFAWREHLNRLRASAEAIGLELDLSDSQILQRALETMELAKNDEHYVRIVVTRGTGTMPNIALEAVLGPPCWVLLVRPLPTTSPTARLQVVERLRNDRRALDPATKSGNYLNNILALAEAKRCGATDCVFLNADGYATEASTSNLFALRGGKVVTPPLTAGLLAGTTRAALIDFCRNRDQETLEIDLRAEDLESAEELWLTSSLRDVAPVTHLNGRELHGGGPGPFAAALAKDFTKWADARARDTDGPAARECAQGL